MSDGLYYLPDGFREGAEGSDAAAEAAASTRRYLGRATPNAASYAGADEFVQAVTATRDTQARGVARAAEDRSGMADTDRQVAAYGEEMDAAATGVLGQVAAMADRGIADGM